MGVRETFNTDNVFQGTFQGMAWEEEVECVGKGGQRAEAKLLALWCLLPTSPSLLLSPIFKATLLYYRWGFFLSLKPS